MSITDVTADVDRALQGAVRSATTSASSSAVPALTGRARLARLLGATVLAGLLATLPFSMHWAGPAFAVDYGLIVAMTVLSISVLGWIGEISLAPVAQMGFGVVAVNVCQVHHVPFGFTLPIVALSSLPISLLLAAFTLRLKGVSFAIATLAFAYMAHKTFFLEYLGSYGAFGGTGTTQVSRPSFVRTDESIYYLELAVLIAVALLCYAINRSRIGARFTALRESEMAFSTLGHPPAAYRFFAICLSGAIATVAGALFVYLQLQVPSNLLLPGQAILFFGYAVAGGLGSVTGALVAGVVFGALPKYLETLTKSEFLNYDLFVIGLVIFVVMMKAPGGLAEVGRRLWRRIEGTTA
ncbi:MAG: branched-chain amino acid transport system permease protein livM [Actinomycetota bacterium]|jgi:branched-chain amino acid transport system permease protein|nr:branched-chain amino acid transport system permease protein livM [Actinomycetota bacterium]MDQ1497664.1 branched-chain amino acid transport system permease protein livM [Actinomycetota bacterium]MDQ1508069.1 branched-chain amino acid transport system permease protein livM [Actinomycetota bacterium]